MRPSTLPLQLVKVQTSDNLCMRESSVTVVASAPSLVLATNALSQRTSITAQSARLPSPMIILSLRLMILNKLPELFSPSSMNKFLFNKRKTRSLGKEVDASCVECADAEACVVVEVPEKAVAAILVHPKTFPTSIRRPSLHR